MDLLAEVATVGQGAASVRQGSPQGVVAPFPDESADVAGVAHLRGVAGRARGAGSHGVQVFAHEVGGAADAFARRVVDLRCHVRGHGDLCVEITIVEDGGDLLERRVHARVNIRVFQGMVALVVDNGSPTRALVDPARAGGQVRPGSRLVAQAPAHDRGVVLVALERAHRAVQVGVGPTRIVGGIVDPLPRPLEAVRLDVSFEHDPQPDLVGQVQQARVRRVVRGTDRVNAHGLHERQVGARPLLVKDAALVGAHLVAVDAVEAQGLPVGCQDAVLDGDAPKSDAQASVPIDEAVSPIDAHARLVEGGVIRVPRAYVSHLEAVGAVAPVVALLEGEQTGAEAVDCEATDQGGLVGAEHPCLDGRIPDPGLVVGVDPEVFDAAGGEAAQADGSEDAGQPPLVLILQIAPGAELVDAHGDRILSGVHAAGDVTLVGKARTAGHAHPRAVDPHARLAFDAVEAQGNQVVLPPVGQLEGASVVADGVRLGRVGRDDREGEVNVRVGGAAVTPVASQHPVAGHVNRVRVVADGWLIPGFFNIRPGSRVGAVIDEGPGTVEAQNAGIIGQMRARRQECSRTGGVGR